MQKYQEFKSIFRLRNHRKLHLQQKALQKNIKLNLHRFYDCLFLRSLEDKKKLRKIESIWVYVMPEFLYLFFTCFLKHQLNLRCTCVSALDKYWIFTTESFETAHGKSDCWSRYMQGSKQVFNTHSLDFLLLTWNYFYVRFSLQLIRKSPH